jgi:hypothetical protein
MKDECRGTHGWTRVLGAHNGSSSRENGNVFGEHLGMENLRVVNKGVVSLVSED